MPTTYKHKRFLWRSSLTITIMVNKDIKKKTKWQ